MWENDQTKYKGFGAPMGDKLWEVTRKYKVNEGFLVGFVMQTHSVVSGDKSLLSFSKY